MAYLSLADAKSYLGIASADTSEDTLISAHIAAAQAAIDGYCGRSFEAATATRYYGPDAVRDQILMLDGDLLAITSLTNGDGSALTSSDYWLWPRSDSPPFWGIRLKSTHTWTFVQDGEISVTGSWAYSVTPPTAVIQATKEYVDFLYRDPDRRSGQVKYAAQAAQVGVLPEHIAHLLSLYRRRTL